MIPFALARLADRIRLAARRGRPRLVSASSALWGGGLLLAMLLMTPPAVRALDVHEVLRYDLFTGRPVGSAGEMELAVAGDGRVLLGWTAYRPAEVREYVRVQWLSPEGLPVAEPIVAVHRGWLGALAARPGRRALVVSGTQPPASGYRLTFLGPGGVVARIDAAAIGCDLPDAVTATGNGYFLTCYSLATRTTHGWWLADQPIRVRGRVELGDVARLALAGGPRTGVALLYQDRDGRILARWMTLWNRRWEPVLVDRQDAFFEGSITHLRDRVFGLAWVHEYAASPDYEWRTRLTAVHAATFRAPGLVRSERRFSRLEGSAEESTGEQRRPRVFRTSPKEQVVGWFDCSYHSSPGGLVCGEDDGLFLRERRFARPSGGIVELTEVPARSQVGFTGERLVTTTLVYRWEDGLYDLEVRAFALE